MEKPNNAIIAGGSPNNVFVIIVTVVAVVVVGIVVSSVVGIVVFVLVVEVVTVVVGVVVVVVNWGQHQGFNHSSYYCPHSHNIFIVILIVQ